MADPTQTQPGVNPQTGNPFLTNLQQWSPIIGAGTQLIGAGMASGQQSTANQLIQQNAQRLYQLAQAERQRRDAMTRAVYPQLLQGMGMNPQQIAQYMGQIPSGSPTDSSYAAPPANGQLPSNNAGLGAKIGGAAMTGLGAYGAAKSAGILPGILGGGGAAAAGAGGALPGVAAGSMGAPLGATGALSAPTVAAPAMAAGGAGAGGGIGATMGALASNPLTWLAAGGIGAGLLANSKIGQGRKTANDWVQGTGGASGMGGQNAYGQQLAQVSNEASTNPNQAKQDFIRDYNTYLQNANQFATANPGNSNRQTVINQMLNKTPALAQTNNTLAQQLGLNGFQWGQPYQGA